LGSPLGIRYDSISVMVGAGMLMLWPPLEGYGFRDLPARAALSLTGHLRGRPDPWLEGALRKAFAEFDRELAVILRDRGIPVGQGQDPGNATAPGGRPGPPAGGHHAVG
jgi:hypothetical protein